MRFKWRRLTPRKALTLACTVLGVWLIVLLQYDDQWEVHIRVYPTLPPRNLTVDYNSVQGHVPVPYDTYVSCRAIIFNKDQAEIEKAVHLRKWLGSIRVTDEELLGRAQNCSELIHNRYITAPLTSEEENYPLAFSILLHEHGEQAERLLRLIYRPQNVYCIHVDAKADEVLHRAMGAIAECFPNVFIAPKRISVVYAHVTRLQAELVCLQELLNRHSGWKYYTNLPSQVLPLRTNFEMVQISKMLAGRNNIEGTLKKVHRDRFNTSWLRKEDQTAAKKLYDSKVHKSEPPHGLKILKGSAYGLFSRQFAEYVFNSTEVTGLYLWSLDTYSPDEHFWATLQHLKVNPQLKTPGGYKGDPGNETYLAAYASWKGEDPCFSKKFVRGICIFGVEDLPYLTTQPHMFANKFHMDFDPLAMHCMEQWLLSRTAEQLVYNNTARYMELHRKMLQQQVTTSGVQGSQ